MILDSSHEGKWAVVINDRWRSNPPSPIPLKIVGVTSHRVLLSNEMDPPVRRAHSIVVAVFDDRELAAQRAQSAYDHHRKLMVDIENLTEERDRSTVAIIRGTEQPSE